MLVLFYHTFRVLSFFPLHVTLLCKEANIMYEQNENPWGTNEAPRPPQPGGNMLATAALICSILAIVSSCCFCLWRSCDYFRSALPRSQKICAISCQNSNLAGHRSGHTQRSHHRSKSCLSNPAIRKLPEITGQLYLYN